MKKIKTLTINSKGHVNQRESTNLEFKQAFHRNVECYIRTICAFANNKGGYLIFGVKDKPREAIGLEEAKLQDFDDYDSKDLVEKLHNFLSIDIEFDLYSFTQEINNSQVSFGVLQVKESNQKPVVCLKTYDRNSVKLREGAIYYRYNARSQEIKAIDLIHLIQTEKEKEQKKWMEHIQRIASIGVENAGIFSYNGDGEMYAGDKKIILDKGILEKIKFIKEGRFVEKDGAPALILKGEIQNAKTMQIVKTDKSADYEFAGQTAVIAEMKQRGFADRIKTKENKKYALSYLFTNYKKENKVEENEKYFWSCSAGSTKVKKYSKECIDDFAKFLQEKQNHKIA